MQSSASYNRHQDTYIGTCLHLGMPFLYIVKLGKIQMMGRWGLYFPLVASGISIIINVA